MDIFEIAQQGVEIQEKEKKELEQIEIDKENAKKAHKVNIFEALEAAAKKDYDWYNRLGESQKAFSPFMLNMWMGMIWNKNSSSRKFTTQDLVNSEIIKSVNYTLNRDVFNAPKEMLWLLACTIQEYGAPFTASYEKSEVKKASDKYEKDVIDYMCQELYSSDAKILDMIDNGLITEDDMEAISKDLETLEDQSGKKKKKKTINK